MLNCLRVDPVANSHAMLDKVRQLTARTHTRTPQINCSSSITAQSLNEHYSLISTCNDAINLLIANLLPTRASQTSLRWKYLTRWTMDKLKPTASALDKLPASFLRLAALIFAKPIAAVFNISLAASYVPHQWKTAVIKPIPKQACPIIPSGYRPISVTAILSRILERQSRQRLHLSSSRAPAQPT